MSQWCKQWGTVNPSQRHDSQLNTLQFHRSNLMLTWRWETSCRFTKQVSKMIVLSFSWAQTLTLDNSRGLSIVQWPSLRALWTGGPSSHAAAVAWVCRPYMKASHRGTTHMCGSFQHMPESNQTAKSLENEKDSKSARRYYVRWETKRWGNK